MRAVLLEPNQLTMLSQFNMSTATWLTQVAINLESDDPTNYAPQVFRKISFPLPDRVPDTLKYVLDSFEISTNVAIIMFSSCFWKMHSRICDRKYCWLSEFLAEIQSTNSRIAGLRVSGSNFNDGACLYGLSSTNEESSSASTHGRMPRSAIALSQRYA